MLTTTEPLSDRQTCADAPELAGGLTPPRSEEVHDGAGMGLRDAEFHAFPVECFPGAVREYVQSQARDLDCDESVVALPVLAALASSIGGTRRIRLKRDWTEPAVLWTAIVADSGTRHRPPLEAAVEPLNTRQLREFQRKDQRMAGFEQEMTFYRSQMRKHKGYGPVPNRPQEPAANRYITRDWNLSMLIPLLTKQADLLAGVGRIFNPSAQTTGDSTSTSEQSPEVQSPSLSNAAPARGLLVCSEQLDGWLRRSSPIRGAELANWLDLYDCRSLTVERRTAQPIHLPLASVSLTGTVSPEVLSQKLTKSKTPCELLSRLLLASPPPRPRRWTDDEVEPSVTLGYSAVIEKLGALTNEIQESGVGEQESESGDVKPKKKKRKPPKMDLTPPRKLDTGALILLLDKAEKRYGPTVREMISQQTYDTLEQPGSSTSDGEVLEELPTPVTVELSPEAKRRFAQFVHEFGQDQADTGLSGVGSPLAASFVQLEGYAARLALVLHLTRWAAGETVDPAVCDVTSMEHGITLARWFANEARRIHAMLSETPEQRDRRLLIDWLQRRGGQASSRDLCRANGRRYATADAAESALKGLAEDGVGGWMNLPAGELGGRSFRVLVLGRAEGQGLRNKGQTGVPSDASSCGTSVVVPVGRISNPALFSVDNVEKLTPVVVGSAGLENRPTGSVDSVAEPTPAVVPAQTEVVSTCEATGETPIPRMAPAPTEAISDGNRELCRTDRHVAPSKKAAVKKATSVAKTGIVAPSTSTAMVATSSTTPTEPPVIDPFLQQTEQQIREDMERRRKQFGPSSVTIGQLALPGQRRK